jgi:hypothetical protein
MPFGRPGGRSILSVVPSVAAAAAVLPPSDGTEGKRPVEREESREEGDVEGLVDVLEDVLGGLDADGEAHHARGDARLLLLLGVELRVRGGGGVDGERPGVPDVGDVGDELESLDEALPRNASGKFLKRELRDRLSPKA